MHIFKKIDVEHYKCIHMGWSHRTQRAYVEEVAGHNFREMAHNKTIWKGLCLVVAASENDRGLNIRKANTK